MNVCNSLRIGIRPLVLPCSSIHLNQKTFFKKNHLRSIEFVSVIQSGSWYNSLTSSGSPSLSWTVLCRTFDCRMKIETYFFRATHDFCQFMSHRFFMFVESLAGRRFQKDQCSKSSRSNLCKSIRKYLLPNPPDFPTFSPYWDGSIDNNRLHQRHPQITREKLIDIHGLKGSFDLLNL